MAKADVQINGAREFDIFTTDEARLLNQVVWRGELGAMEAYIDGLWTCPDLKALFIRLMKMNVGAQVRTWSDWLQSYLNRWINYQTVSRSREVIDIHYNLGNTFYELLLGPSMQYSCALGREDSNFNLTEAQERKMDLILRKLKLTPTCRVLDIGCGFGTLAYHLSEHCAQVVGVTLSERQFEWANRNFAREIKTGKLLFILSDYRKLPADLGKFDRVVSVGFLEHVGVINLPTFCDVVDRVLTDDGIACIHTIGKEENSQVTSPFIRKYIFPHGQLPTPIDICSNFLKKFRLEDWHNFGKDYSKTLDAWYENFKNCRFSDERQNRIWELYLTSCSAAFATRRIQLWQIVFTRKSSTQEYRSVR